MPMHLRASRLPLNIVVFEGLVRWPCHCFGVYFTLTTTCQKLDVGVGTHARGGVSPSRPPNFLPILMVPRLAGSGFWATRWPCCHSTAMMYATKVSDFPLPAPPVNAVMHDSSSTYRTAKACEGFNAGRWTSSLRISWSLFDIKGGIHIQDPPKKMLTGRSTCGFQAL